MKKYEDLTDKEKKEALQDFKKSSFYRIRQIRDLEFIFSIVWFILILYFMDFVTSNIIFVILAFAVMIAVNEFVHYKERELVKDYYELKNNK